ncbi:MAG: sensor histidine kinase [Kosmotoga sp.]|nr:MAG: sensor histidine kinase [Kosmotoga sp.]
MGLRTISDHIVDICQNAVESGAKTIELTINEKPKETLVIEIKDDGRGIDKEKLDDIIDPFYTEKNKKIKFGLGLPMLKFAAESTGGTFKIKSKKDKGTTVKAFFNINNIDCQPLGNLAQALFTILTMSEKTSWNINRVFGDSGYSFSSTELRKKLGDDYTSSPSKMKLLYDILVSAEASIGGSEYA